MKTLIVILVLFSSSLFANEYSPNDIINFIKKSEKAIIKLARFDSKINKFIEYEDNDKNYYILIDNKENIARKDTFNRINQDYFDHLIRRYDSDKIVTTSIPLPGLGNENQYDEKKTTYWIVLNNNEFIQIHWCWKNNEGEVCKEVRKGYGFGGYCTNNENLLKYGVVICEEIDQNDITAKPLESIDKYVFKLLSIYDTGSKNNFNLNPDIGIEVVQKRKKSAVEGFFVTPENEVPEIKKETKPKPKVVQIIGTGSGFYVTSKGHIITNNHVIDKCEKVLLNNETLEVLSVNKKADLALLKSKILETPFLYLRQNKIKQGEDVVVIGYPFGKDINKESTITKGIISALVGLGDDDSKIQIDAAIQPGNSGGPTIGLDGQVVGVTVASANIATFLEAFGTITQNMNFSVKPKYVIKIMNANGVEVPILDQQIQMNTAEIYEYANPATVYLECWGRN